MAHSQNRSNTNRRGFLTMASGALCVTAWPHAARSQSPNTPIRLVVGFPPGGSTDALSRQLAEVMRAKLDRTVLVENKAGAAGRIGPEFVKTAPADGSVILVTPNPMITQYPSVYKKLSYDPLRDFVPLGQIATYPLLISVGPAVPAGVKTIADYLQWAKLDGKNGFFASPAAGSTPHFVGVMLGKAAGVELTHVPYRGDAPAIQDLLGGQVPMSINTPAAQLSHVGGGKLRVLATTGAKRLPELPQVPTIGEAQHPNLKTSDWFGMFVPSGTPTATVDRLQTVVREALSTPSIRDNFAKLGIETAFVSGADFGKQLREETRLFAELVKAVGFTPED